MPKINKNVSTWGSIVGNIIEIIKNQTPLNEVKNQIDKDFVDDFIASVEEEATIIKESNVVQIDSELTRTEKLKYWYTVIMNKYDYDEEKFTKDCIYDFIKIYYAIYKAQKYLTENRIKYEQLRPIEYDEKQYLFHRINNVSKVKIENKTIASFLLGLLEKHIIDQIYRELDMELKEYGLKFNFSLGRNKESYDIVAKSFAAYFHRKYCCFRTKDEAREFRKLPIRFTIPLLDKESKEELKKYRGRFEQRSMKTLIFDSYIDYDIIGRGASNLNSDLATIVRKCSKSGLNISCKKSDVSDALGGLLESLYYELVKRDRNLLEKIVRNALLDHNIEAFKVTSKAINEIKDIFSWIHF